MMLFNRQIFSTSARVILALCCAIPVAAAQDYCEGEPIVSSAILYDRNTRPMVQVSIAGQDRFLILDTGGAKSILDPDAARELDLRIGQFAAVAPSPFDNDFSARPSEVYMDVRGRRSSSFATVDELQFGGRSFGTVEFVLSSLDRIQNDRTDSVGTLGADFMVVYDVVFDFGEDEFQLYMPNQCSFSSLPEGAETDGFIAVPFTTNTSNHIRFPLHLDDQMLTAVLDTGAYETILSLPAAQRRFSIDLNAPDVIRTGELAGNNMASLYRRRFSSLQIETLLLLDPMINLMPDLMAQSSASPWRVSIMDRLTEGRATLPDFILGMSVLSRYRLHIAYDNREFYLFPVAGN
jgi:hypothetical protein